MFWLFSLLSASCQNHGKKLKSRHRCLSRRNRRRVRKELRPLKDAKLAIWLHFGLSVVKAKLVNNKGVECWHRGAAVKHSGNTTNLAADMTKAWKLNHQRSHVPRSKLCWALLVFGLCRARSYPLKIKSSTAIISKEICYNIVMKILVIYSPTCISQWNWWVSVWSVHFNWRKACLLSWRNRKHDGCVSQRYRLESRRGEWALFPLMPSALSFVFLWHMHTLAHTCRDRTQLSWIIQLHNKTSPNQPVLTRARIHNVWFTSPVVGHLRNVSPRPLVLSNSIAHPRWALSTKEMNRDFLGSFQLNLSLN